MSSKLAARGTSAKTAPRTTKSSQHGPASLSPPTGTSDESPTGNYGPADILEQDGREYLRYESKVVPNKIFIFDATKTLNGVRCFRCRDCHKAAQNRGPPTPAGIVRPVNVRDGMMLNDPEKPSGLKHICLREKLSHPSACGKEQSASKASGRRGRSLTRASSDTPRTSKAKIQDGPSVGSSKAGAVAAEVTAGSTVRKSRALLRATLSVPFSLKDTRKKTRVASSKAKARVVAEGAAPEAKAAATEAEASDEPATAKKRRVDEEQMADANLPHVDDNQQDLSSDAATLEPTSTKKLRVYESEADAILPQEHVNPEDPRSDAAALESSSTKKRRVYELEADVNLSQEDVNPEDQGSDAVAIQVDATDDPSSANQFRMDQEPSDNDNLTHVENDQNDGRADSPDLDLQLSAPTTPAPIAAEDNQEVAQEDGVESLLDGTLGSLSEDRQEVVQEDVVGSIIDDMMDTLETPKQDTVDDACNARSSSASSLNFDGFPEDVRLTVDQIHYVGDDPVVMLNGLPHRIYFAGPPHEVLIDNDQLITLTFGETKEVLIDGEMHVIRFGGPMKELIIGDAAFAGVFGGPPIVAIIGEKQHEIRLCGAPPEVKIEQDPAYELVRHENVAHQSADPANEDTPQASLNLAEFAELMKRLPAGLIEELQKARTASSSHADASDSCSPPAATPPSEQSQPNVPVASATAAVNNSLQPDLAPNFGPADVHDDGSVRYKSIFGDTYVFSLVAERQATKDGATTWFALVKRRHLMVDVPLVKTVDDQFVERDPAYPFGNIHLCARADLK
ncbi:Protein PCF-11 a [Aphelenchoides avenae]|nr:Protein PCF-11 a [Aphelenchus avenae]